LKSVLIKLISFILIEFEMKLNQGT